MSKVKEIRTALELTQLEFAARLECGLTSERRWEYTGQLPENRGVMRRLEALAREAGITLDEANIASNYIASSIANGQAAEAARRRRDDARAATDRTLRELLEGLRNADPRARNAAIIALSKAGAATRSKVKQAVAEAVAAHPLPDDELADWRALQGEPFHFPDEAEDKTEPATAKAAR